MANINMPAPPDTSGAALGNIAKFVDTIGSLQNSAVQRQLQRQQIQQAKDTQAGVINPMQQFEMLRSGAKLVPQGTPGAMPFQVRDQSGNVQPSFIVPGPNVSLLMQLQDLNDKKLGAQKTSLEMDRMKNPIASPDQLKAAGIADRLQQNNEIINGLEKGKSAKGAFDPTSLKSQIQRSSLFPEKFQEEGFKKNDAAENGFVTAALTHSGMDITRMTPQVIEMTKAQYFARPGDSDAVLQQKAEARQLLSERARQESIPIGVGGAPSSSIAVHKQQKMPPGTGMSSGGGTINAGLVGSSPKAMPSTVTQNGHTYTLNPQTGKYE